MSKVAVGCSCLLLVLAWSGNGCVDSSDDNADEPDSQSGEGEGEGEGEVQITGTVLLGEMQIGESTMSNATTSFMQLAETGPVCADFGVCVQTFGDCSYSPTPTCTPACDLATQLCVWDTDCGSSKCIDNPTPVCEPPCGGDQFCRWDQACSIGYCTDGYLALTAGQVTISGATHQSTVTCTADANNSYTCSINAEADFFAGGETIDISAPGEEFPAFSGNLVAPMDLAMTTDLSALELADFDGATGLDLAWTAGNGTMSIGLTITNLDDSSGMLYCTTEDDGALTISAEAIAAVSSNPSMVSISLMRQVSSTVDQVTLLAQGSSVGQSIMQ